MRWALWLWICLGLAACESDRVLQSADTAGQPGSVFVRSNGWHTGIIIARRDLTAEAIPEIAMFPDAPYLEFGWGDAEFYPAKRTSLSMTLLAGLVPTPAVMHVAPRRRPRTHSGPGSETVALQVRNMKRLVAFIAASFDRSGDHPAKPGLEPGSRFIPATGRFHLANTCNSWTARALRAGGLAVDESSAARATDLMVQLRSLSSQSAKR